MAYPGAVSRLCVVSHRCVQEPCGGRSRLPHVLSPEELQRCVLSAQRLDSHAKRATTISLRAKAFIPCGTRLRPLGSTEESGETVGRLSPQARQGVPVVLADVRQEAAATTGAEAHGRGGEAGTGLTVQEVRLQFLGREAVGGWGGALRPQADFPARDVLGPRSLAELESRNPVLTQGGHELSPGVH
jgi:hypothetical protein